MTPQEMDRIRNVSVGNRVIRADDRGAMTLLYGYDVERRTVHVYQMEGEIHRIVYTEAHSNDFPTLFEHRAHSEFPVNDLPADKRLYPEFCDFAFCERLAEMGVHLPFTTFGGRNPREARIVGRVIEDFPDYSSTSTAAPP